MASDKNAKQAMAPIIIVRRNKKHGHGHHGGSWKVAFADFMTAMMAFFLLLYLLEAATPKELAAIAGYFQNPGYKYNVGPGGADASVMDLMSPMEESTQLEIAQEVPQESLGVMGDQQDVFPEESEKEEEEIPSDHEESLSEESLYQQLQQMEQRQLESLENQLEAEIASADSALHVLSEQIQLELTELGLSIQIIDKERRPMFAEGSTRLRDYAAKAINALAPIIDKVPNGVSIVGHTDAKNYDPGSAYSNWELSADRANSARRALIAGAYPESKVIVVQGMGSRSPLLPENPLDPANRRIDIIVLKKAVEDAMRNIGPNGTQAAQAPDPSSPKIPEPSPRKMSETEVDAAIDAEYRRK